MPPSPDPTAYLQQVADREQNGGPYAPGLAEPLTILGLYHRQRGDLRQALDHYQRALHVARINDGLNSERQLPILLEIIDLYKMVGDYQSLDDSLRYYQHIRGLGRPPYDERTIGKNLEYLQWQQEAFRERTDGKRNRHLLQAYLLNRKILDDMAADPETSFEAYRDVTLSQMHNLYQLLSTDPVILTSNGYMGTEGPPDERVNKQLAHIQQTAIGTGRVLMTNLIERAQAQPARDLAALHLELGDWCQWNGQTQTARREYARVEELLRGADENQLLSQWLDQPMELPDERGLWRQAHESATGPGLITATYKVSARGEAKSIEVNTADDAHSGSAMRLKRMLRDTHFRPRFSQGKAERSGTVTRHYRLLR